ncbi:ATP-binding protein [Arthrobacter sp.]|uniref:ATP-binding protein n=1 Tax=Arthrobacter sp. TaxID=1667 RepID=UPI003A90E83E
MSHLPPPLRFLLSNRQFGDLPLRRRVLLSQLPLTIATALVVLVDLLFASAQVSEDAWFQIGLATIAVLTVAAGIIPWQRLPTGSYWVIPLLDLAGILFLAAGAYPILTGLPMLAIIPVFWMAWSALHPRATLVVGFFSTLVIAWAQYLHAGQDMTITTFGRPLVMPIIVVALAATANIAVGSMMAADHRAAVALDASRTQAALLDAVLNAASVGVVAVDRDGHDILMNDKQRLHHSTGTPEDNTDPNESQLLLFGAGRRSERLDVPLPPEERPVYRAVRGAEFTDELMWIGQAEAAEALAVSARRLKGPHGEFDGSVIVFKEVTELIHANQAKDRFLASVSHELRTPLTSIIGYLEVAQDIPGLPAPAVRSLGVAERNAQRLLHLVNDLLTAAADRMELHHRPSDLAAIVRDCVAGQQQAAQAAGLQVHLEGPESLPLVADPERLGQVVDNLVSNAVKYTHRGGSIVVRVGYDGDAALVAVRDTGPGLAPEEVEQLFTRFYRTDSVRDAGIPGTGLGLAITRELVEAHGGTFSVESAPGLGSTFTVRVPRGDLGT